jgi:hypothetical protein
VYPYAVYGADRAVKIQDFDDRVDVIPVADPNIFSMSQRVTLANENLKIAMSNPQMHNLHEAYRRVYEALGTRQIDTLLKPQEVPTPKDPATENAEALQMKMLKAFPEQDHDAHIAAHRAFMATRMVQINPMVYALLQGHISDHVAMKAHGEIGAMIQEDPNMQMMQQQDPQGFKVQFDSMVAKRVAEITTQLAQEEAGAQKPDPLVQLKQRELDLKAMDMQRKAMETQMDFDIKESQFDEKLDLEKMKLENQDEQSDERLQVAKDKLNLQAMQMEQRNAKKKA